MNTNELNQIANQVAQLLGKATPSKTGTGIQVPTELLDPTSDQTKRGAVLEAYTARVMDHPSTSWNETERRAVHEQTQNVLKGLGY
jgi:hypothetical protein